MKTGFRECKTYSAVSAPSRGVPGEWKGKTVRNVTHLCRGMGGPPMVPPL
jgi:hypothetical protein